MNVKTMLNMHSKLQFYPNIICLALMALHLSTMNVVLPSSCLSVSCHLPFHTEDAYA